MPTARCQNDDCDREDPWTLRKQLSEYSRDGPTCPECGTTRVAVEGAAGGADAPQAGQRGGQGQSQQAARAPAQGGQQQAQGGELATPSGDEAVLMGAQAGNLLMQANSDDPAEKAAAMGKLFKLGGSAAAQYGERIQQDAVAGNQRAQQASDDDIGVADQYPSCPECGGQLTSIPESGEFTCPHCGERLEHDPQA